ncbi:MAG: hypothetical protein HFE63_02120 [Clostridiales bacterium]|nr:hypothetical protein [Clostridiales bacterium]
MAWYNEIGAESDVVISSRVRFSRNIVGYPFGDKLTDTGRSEIIEKVTKALALAELETIDLVAKSPLEANALVEERFISSHFAAEKAPHTLLLDENKQLAVTICDKDHVRIQACLAGLALDSAFEKAAALDDLLDNGVETAYSESVGYLTQNPTDLGTGMRASVVLHLPAMALAGRIGITSRNLARLGITMRSFIGESGYESCALYQISNSVTMGMSETEIIEKLTTVAKQLVDGERKLRNTLKSDSFARLCDRVMRANGILQSAYMMSADEFMQLWSDARLGTALGILDKTALAEFDALLVTAMPANLLLASGQTGDIAASELDIIRAKAVREGIN